MIPGANRTMNYGNLVPVKMNAIPGGLGLVCLGLGFILWPLFLAAGVFLLVSGYFTIAWLLFSPKSGNLQERINGLALAHLDWTGKGKALDIGCGNGPLAISLAQRYSEAEVVGIDSWGKGWGYSMRICGENARLAGVDQRVSFRQGSASNLPLEDESFDLVVSNLVFHEVKDAVDKRRCIREAMRILKPQGVFVLQDLFLLKAYYGTPEELVKTVRGCEVREVELIRTCDAPFIPGVVKLPFMLGRLAILRGVK